MQTEFSTSGTVPAHGLGDRFLISNPPGNRSERLIIPDGTPGMLIVEEGGFQRKIDGTVKSYRAGDIVLFGQKTRSVAYCCDERAFRASGYKLDPTLLYRLFGVSAHELTDTFVSLADLNIGSLAEVLQRADTKTAERTEKEKILYAMLRRIRQTGGLLNIGDTCRELGQNYKSMQRLFHRYVGVSPKFYARLMRFNRSVVLGMQERYNLTDTAYQSGYYDQNHFIKEFKSFTGTVPSRLLKQQIDPAHIAYLRESR